MNNEQSDIYFLKVLPYFDIAGTLITKACKEEFKYYISTLMGVGLKNTDNK